MHCRNCGFPLWNITARACPECGHGFRPTEFDFAPGSVHYCCPACPAKYVGTSERGHLVPSEFACAQCGQTCRMDEMALVPANGDGAATSGSSGHPWLERNGIVRAFGRSVVEITLRPERFARGVPWQAAQRDSLLFLATGLGIAVVTIVTLQLCWLVALNTILSIVGAPAPMMVMFAPGRLLLLVVTLLPIGIAIAAVGAMVESAIAHLILRSPARALPLGHTRQIYFYFFGAAAALTPVFVLPCVGGLLAMIWLGYGIYVTVAMLRASHGTSTGRTLVAVLVGRVTNAVAGIALAFTILLTAPQLFGLPPGVLKKAFQPAGSSPLARALVDYRTAKGMWPTTPMDVVAADPTLGFDLLSLVDGDDSLGAIGRIDFAVIWDGDVTAIQAEGAAMAARIPAGSAFRIGRGHFLYPLSDGDPEDWLVVRIDSIPPSSQATDVYIVSTATGSRAIPAIAFATVLAEENARLAARGRPPLPELSTLVEVSGAPSDADAIPAAPEEAGEEEEPAGDQLDAESDPDPR